MNRLIAFVLVCTFIESGFASSHSLSQMPYRQDDPKWANDIMWNRRDVIEVDVKYNKQSPKVAESLLREFDDGNTIGNEGCGLTALSMVLHLLDSKKTWTPRTLNKVAQAGYYYTPSGLSMATLYADLVSDASNGGVQLIAKEEFLSGEPGWPKKFANTVPLIRAYRGLKPEERAGVLLMVKMGTYDDTVASHYIILHPERIESPENRDPEILDPAKPLDANGPWFLSDACKRIVEDPEIKKEWAKKGIVPLQIGGAFAFAKQKGKDGKSAASLIKAWATELAR